MPIDPSVSSVASGRDQLGPTHVDVRRRLVVGACMGFFLVSACEATPMNVTLDVVVFSYLDRPIFDIFIDRKVGESSGVYPRTGGSTVTGVTLALGPKKVSWRLGGPEGAARNGDTVVASNAPSLAQPPDGAKYLAVHIYPDDTVELLTSKRFPEPSPRGEVEIARLEKHHGK
jgi:hypothetical protein